jgi:hypothetical protein
MDGGSWKRREFITLLGVAAAWPLAARAQQAGKLPIIGILGLASAAAAAPYVNAVRVGLRDLGYVEGQNLIVEYRFGDGNYDRLPNLAAELVHLNVDLLVTFAAPGTEAAKSATVTIPIVMAVTADAVGTGLIASLAHPGSELVLVRPALCPRGVLDARWFPHIVMCRDEGKLENRLAEVCENQEIRLARAGSRKASRAIPAADPRASHSRKRSRPCSKPPGRTQICSRSRGRCVGKALPATCRAFARSLTASTARFRRP